MPHSLLLTIALAAAAAQGERPLQADAVPYNLMLGTQTFGSAYQFTDQPLLLETAQAIWDMGSTVVKFKLDKSYAKGKGANAKAELPGIDSLTALCRDEPTHRRVLDMPFRDYLLWAYPFRAGWWSKGLSKTDADREYEEIHDLTVWLLTTYAGTGKRFYLGHWEGDWYLRPGYDTKNDDVVKPEAVAGMIAWLNVRQDAIEAAKRETPHEGVDVFGYTEVNLVKLAMADRPSLTRDVLPHTRVDYVSYSSYDTQGSADGLRAALDFIEAKLPPKPTLGGKRVFIGEYGFPAESHSPAEQDGKSREVMRTALAWGCPFVLYWEMYNNEVKDGRQRGFWLIDDKGVKQPVYETHQRFYAWARGWLAEQRAKTGKAPDEAAFRAAAVAWLGG